MHLGGAPMTRVQERAWTPSWPINLAATLGPLSRGGADPTMRTGPDGVWRTTRTPEGPATVHYSRTGDQVRIRAWGPGAGVELDLAPRLLGADDDPRDFPADAHPVMAAAYERFGAGWRVLRTQRVLEAARPGNPRAARHRSRGPPFLGPVGACARRACSGTGGRSGRPRVRCGPGLWRAVRGRTAGSSGRTGRAGLGGDPELVLAPGGG